jgi:hypothetical protein
MYMLVATWHSFSLIHAQTVHVCTRHSFLPMKESLGSKLQLHWNTSIDTNVLWCAYLLRVRMRSRDKAIGLSVCLSVDKKIGISRHLGTWATRNHNESVEIVEKSATLCFESFGKAHVHPEYSVLFATPINHTCVHYAHAHNLVLNHYVGKGRQQAYILLQCAAADALRDAYAACGIYTLQSSSLLRRLPYMAVRKIVEPNEIRAPKAHTPRAMVHCECYWLIRPWRDPLDRPCAG